MRRVVDAISAFAVILAAAAFVGLTAGATGWVILFCPAGALLAVLGIGAWRRPALGQALLDSVGGRLNAKSYAGLSPSHFAATITALGFGWIAIGLGEYLAR